MACLNGCDRNGRSGRSADDDLDEMVVELLELVDILEESPTKWACELAATALSSKYLLMKKKNISMKTFVKKVVEEFFIIQAEMWKKHE